jgi:hypothetical protein
MEARIWYLFSSCHDGVYFQCLSCRSIMIDRRLNNKGPCPSRDICLFPMLSWLLRFNGTARRADVGSRKVCQCAMRCMGKRTTVRLKYTSKLFIGPYHNLASLISSRACGTACSEIPSSRTCGNHNVSDGIGKDTVLEEYMITSRIIRLLVHGHWSAVSVSH